MSYFLAYRNTPRENFNPGEHSSVNYFHRRVASLYYTLFLNLPTAILFLSFPIIKYALEKIFPIQHSFELSKFAFNCSINQFLHRIHLCKYNFVIFIEKIMHVCMACKFRCVKYIPSKKFLGRERCSFFINHSLT